MQTSYFKFLNMCNFAHDRKILLIINDHIRYFSIDDI
jgi:hypothetical protein